MLEDRKVAAATHNITAWYLRTKLNSETQTTSLVADYDDDGEAQAGGRLLHLISMAAREGVAVMVMSYFLLNVFLTHLTLFASCNGAGFSN